MTIEEDKLPRTLYIDPKLLYEFDPELEESYMAPYYGTFFGSIAGLTGIALSNFVKRRPYYANIPGYILSAACSGAVGQFVQNKLRQLYVFRDRVHRHYIQLHPEDFPMQRRVKIADMLEDWMPTR